MKIWAFSIFTGCSEVRRHLELHILHLLSRSRLRVRAHALLKEVVLVLEADPLHEVERIRLAIHLRVPQLHQKTIRDELDVLRHEVRVHSDELARERLRDELLLNLHRIADDLVNLLLVDPVHDLAVQEAREVRVQSFVARNELVGEREARHEATLLHPEDGTECTAEEDALDGRKSNEASGKIGIR